MFVGDGKSPLDKQFLVGNFFGIPLYIHIILIVYAVITILTSLSPFRWDAILFPLFVFLSVYMHELGHALTAKRLGAKPKRIVLHLFGGVAEIPAGLGRKQQLWVIAMGPAVSGVLMLVGFTLGVILNILPVVGKILISLGWINFVLFLFNVLPIFPLDGGQFYREYMSLKLGTTEAIKKSLPLSSFVLAIILVFSFVFIRSIGLFGLIIAGFLAYYNYQEYLRYQHLFRGGFFSSLFTGGGAFPKLGDKLTVWWYRSQAESLMKKAEDVGVHALSKKEREVLDRYLDAKIRLRD